MVVAHLVVDSDLRMRMGAEAKSKAKEYDIVHQAQRLLSVYEEAREVAKAGQYVICNR